jgi:hypothetical protein
MLLTILISIITLNFYLNNCGKKTELIMASCNFNVAPKLFYLPKTGKTGKKPAKPSQNRIKHFKNQRKLRLLVGMRTRGVQLNAAVMAQERGASSSSRKRARTPSPPAIPSSSTSTDPDEEEEEEEVSDELLPEEQEEVFDSQGHSSHGRWRCPEPGCGVLLGANAVQANGVHTHAARHRRTSEAAAAAAAAAATIPVIFVYERAGGACVHASTCDHTMSKSSWAAVASCFLRELRVPSLPVGSRTFYLMVQEGSHNPLHCPLAGMI